MGTSIKLGRILGIPLGLHYSWFLVFFLVTSSLAISLGELRPSWSLPERWGVALASSALLFASVVAHELSHSLVAIRSGIPVKGITLFIFGGVAQISREAARPGTEFLVAVVGPLSSILLGFLFLGLSYVLEPVSVHLMVMTGWLFLVNVALGVFNMIPGFPLDGGRVFRAAVWAISGNYAVATRIATIAGQGVAIAFVAGGGLLFLLQDEFLQGIWLAFIGWFLWQAAGASYRQFRQRQRLQGLVARDLMTTDCLEVSPESSLRDLAEAGALGRGQRCLMVVSGGRVEGLLHSHAVRRVGRKSWATTSVRRLMAPLESMQGVAPDDDSYRVLEVLDEEDVGLVPVMDGGEVVGVIVRERLAQMMRSRTRPRA